MDERTPDLPDLLRGAEAARSRPVESAAAIARAVEAAPDDPDVRLAAYRFHFYSHDYESAIEDAYVMLVHAARRLNLATDWRMVRAGDADFTAHEFAPGLYLQALVALGYCAARSGRHDLAAEALGQAGRLDPSDRFGGGHLCELLLTRSAEEE